MPFIQRQYKSKFDGQWKDLPAGECRGWEEKYKALYEKYHYEIRVKP